jgi:hypothetical protein
MGDSAASPNSGAPQSTKKGTLYFHPPDIPVEVWAVKIDRSGVHWFDAEVLKVTERNVMARYAGEIAGLDRDKLWRRWAWWRGVMFVSSRTGRIAGELEEFWCKRHGRAAGGVPPAMRMPLDEARRLLGLPLNYTKEDVLAAFRREVKKAHAGWDGGEISEVSRGARPIAGGVGDERATAEGARLRPKRRDAGLPERRLSSSEPGHDPPPAGKLITLKEAGTMTARRAAMAARDRWVLVEENGDLWLLKREGPAVRGRIVSRECLRREFPRLYAELVASNNKDTPRVIVER